MDAEGVNADKRALNFAENLQQLT